MKPQSMKYLVATVAVLAALVVPPSSSIATGQTTNNASAQKHRIVLTVGSRTVQWVSPGIYSGDDVLVTRVFYKGHLLEGGTPVKNCVLDYSGYGLSARIHGCDNGNNPSPIRIRVASARDDVARIVFTYGPN